MKKIIKLTESDLTRIVKRVLKETVEDTQDASFARDYNGYGKCLSGAAFPEYHPKSKGIKNSEIKEFDPYGVCTKTLKGNPTQDQVMGCVSVLCSLKREKTPSGPNPRRFTMTYNCYTGVYQDQYDVAAIMC